MNARVQKINSEISRLVDQRDKLIDGSDHLSSDLALETNVQKIRELYESGSWQDLNNTLAASIEIVKNKNFVNVGAVQAIEKHASIKPGFVLPSSWNAGRDVMLRRGAPIVLASKSGVGKSTTSRNLAVHNLNEKRRTVIMTNEDTKAEILIGLYTIWRRLHTGESIGFEEVEKWLNQNDQDSSKFQHEVSVFKKFCERSEKYICIVECEYWSWSRIIYGIEWTENHFGCAPDCVIIDYVQRIEPEPVMSRIDYRLQHVHGSRLITNYIKRKQCVGILVSQLNESGGTAESTQYQRDAGQLIHIEREYDENSDKYSNEIVIRLKKFRRGATGRGTCYFDSLSGAFISSPTWRPITEPRMFGDKS